MHSYTNNYLSCSENKKYLEKNANLYKSPEINDNFFSVQKKEENKNNFDDFNFEFKEIDKKNSQTIVDFGFGS